MSLVGVWLASWIKDNYGDSTDSLLGVLRCGRRAGRSAGSGYWPRAFIGHTERPDAPFILEKKHRWWRP